MTRAAPRCGPRGIGARAARVVPGVEPVGGPLPDVPGHVGQPVAVRRVGADGGGADEAVGAGVALREAGPGRRSSGARRRAPARRPTGSGDGRGRRARRTPTRPRSAAASPTTRRTPARRSRRRARPGGRRGPPGRIAGPRGDPTRRRAPAATTPRRRPRASAGSRPAAGPRTRTTSRSARPRSGGRSPRRRPRTARWSRPCGRSRTARARTSCAGPSPSAG